MKDRKKDRQGTDHWWQPVFATHRIGPHYINACNRGKLQQMREQKLLQKSICRQNFNNNRTVK